MTLNEALILSYVKRGIGYGYSILQHVENSRSDEWVDFSRAGMYKTLDKLEKNGLVKKTLEQKNNRPPRNVYRITGSGDKALTDYLESGFDFDYQVKDDLDAYLVTAVAASPDARSLSEKVRRRIEAVKKHIEVYKNEWPEDKNSYPFIVYALYRRRIDSFQLELKWLTWLSDILDSTSDDILHMTWGESGGE
ncbi:PadR family transcriptional regulator [Candidatus Latescibacterota bacterium]